MGEAPGEREEELGIPFVGASGYELTQMLSEAKIIRESCMLTNVFLTRPKDNNIFEWTMKKAEADAAWQALGNSGKYPFAPLKAGAYIDPARLGSVRRLHRDLVAFNPTLIIALGNTPLWALAGQSGISKTRGTLIEADLVGGTRGYKVLPTYHPSYILRSYQDRPTVIADLMKAKRESLVEEYSRPIRELWLEPTLEDIREFRNYLLSQRRVAVDIETARGQITCIGFGTRDKAICIPFLDARKQGWSYWPTPADEADAWYLVRELLSLPLEKIFQNGMYDIQWLWRKMGMTPQGTIHDTMLLHHSMFPEMQKGLGFLASIYTNETSWKKLRPKKLTTEKRDDE